MKLYYFNPNTYGEQYFVCAESKERAIQALLDSIKELDPKHGIWSFDYETKCRTTAANLEDGYTLEEFPPYKIFNSEIA